MKRLVFIGALNLVLLFSIAPIAQFVAATGQWYYPISNYEQRIQYKDFGTQVDPAFYKGRESLFPTKFYGFHAATDLEALPNETPAPVYAIANGKVLYARTAEGYGGVIVQSIDGEPITALYGHVHIPNTIKEGDTVIAGQQIAVLGKGFSPETSGERQHLHFAIHKGTSVYLLGHEPTKARLEQQWENPTNYLQSHQAIAPGQNQNAQPSTSQSPYFESFTPAPATQNSSFWGRLVSWFTNLFSFH